MTHTHNKTRKEIPMQYVKSQKISLKDNPDMNEKWVQAKIEEEPAILGLGENVELRDTERPQPAGGRLDLLLKDPDSEKLFTVELMLGECDPDHIIRTIEYWDIERKRYPHIKHCAVIIAENITSRFWNVINLFNGSIPLIAIQMDARKVEDKITLNFITVLDEKEYQRAEEEKSEPTDRAYWERKSTKEILIFVDKFKNMLNKFFPNIELNYNKFYIGLQRDNVSDNFISFCPRKKYLDITFRKDKVSDKTINYLEDNGLPVDWKDRMDYRHYRIRVPTNDFDRKLPHIEYLFKTASGLKVDMQEKAA